MSSGWRAPAPLPMYQPVVLKHVPTMVRRRYDHRLIDNNNNNNNNNLIDDQPQPQPQPQDSPTTPGNGGEIKNDGDLDLTKEEEDALASENNIISTDQESSHHCGSNDIDGSQVVEDETQDNKTFSSFTNNQQGSVSEGGHSNMELNLDNDVTTLSNGLENPSYNDQDMDSEKREVKDDWSNVTSHALIKDSSPCEDETKHNKLASFGDEQGNSEGEDNGDKDAKTASYSSIKSEFLEKTEDSLNVQALHSKHSGNVDDGPKVADHAPITVRGQHSPPPLPMYHPVVLQHVPTVVRRKYDHFDTDKLDQIEDDGELGVNDEDNLASEDSSSEQGSVLEDVDCDNMEHSLCIVESSVKDTTHGNGLEKPNNIHGWRESEDADLQDDSNPSSEVDDGVSAEWQHDGEESSTENCETGIYHDSVGTRSIEPTDLDSIYSKRKDTHALVADFNLDEDETKHKRLAVLSNEQEFKTEASMKCLEEDKYESPGRHSPPPLPMYQPVALKDVPTMVRKKYEHSDGEKLCQNEDATPSEGGIEDDGDIDVDDGLLSETISSEQGQGKSEGDDLQDLNPGSDVDAGVSVECQQSGVDNSIVDCETGIYNELVSSETIQPTDSHPGNTESDDDKSKVANNAPVVDSNLDENETRNKRLTSLALHSEYSESEDEEPKFANHAPFVVDFNLEYEIQDKTLADFSNEQGVYKDEYNGAEDAKNASCHCVKYEALDGTYGNSVDEHGLHPEDTKRYGDISEGSSFCENVTVIREAEVRECGIVNDDKQDIITQMYTEDFGTQNITQRSLDAVNLKCKNDGTKDMNSSYNMCTAVKTEVQGELSQGYSSYQKELKPESLRKSMEEGEYELCCPYCKHCFTKTLIIQRKESSQRCRITCFTSLIALFCCGRE